ncbi:PLDc N-terminal domain-containing protein [Marinomonas rhodophyticola]|uniref:PLDc N-terminal domain-containing protein n=1 Tax=Marinomonas rhodophyticola TaxID=2992803 RepID=A0ABT3KAM5_9GAMM|nr:PLDc N-terminal domain-containing protein [Marinomonas sp. KJ51-3]MCW4627600.1 PLDc N-terminal domain-containing protein [Marinomonas sp. KJ51-3]
MPIFEVLLEWVSFHWVTIIVVLHIGLSAVTSLHVLLFKENERTSLAWIGLVIFSPVLGSLFYWLFGINRIRRIAKREHPQTLKQDFRYKEDCIDFHCLPENWHSSVIAGYAIHPVNYVDDNSIEPLLTAIMLILR